MAIKPPHTCNHHGCSTLTTNRYCIDHTIVADTHRKDKRNAYDKQRPAYHAWYNTVRWRMLRIQLLQDSPLCVVCYTIGKVTPASIIDHIVSHKGNATLFWDIGNLQVLCKRCHDVKTATQDGGFNNHT